MKPHSSSFFFLEIEFCCVIWLNNTDNHVTVVDLHFLFFLHVIAGRVVGVVW